MTARGDPWREVSDALALMDEQVASDLHRAAPYIDANTKPGSWSASAILKILWRAACVELELHLSGNSAHRLNKAIERVNRAAAEIEAKLQVARERYRDGFFANPFGPPVARATKGSCA